MQQPNALPFSVTCETHDEAVLHCLNALAYFAEHFSADEGQEPGAAVPLPNRGFPTPAGWLRDDGLVTFRFSDPRRRGTFLGEATRLLSGKWTRVALDDPSATA